MKSINELLKRKPHPHHNCHFMYINEAGEQLNVWNSRNAPMPLKMVVNGLKYVIAPMQIHHANHVPKPGEYITKDCTPQEIDKMIKIALETKQEDEPLTVEQIKKITKYMRDHT